MTTKRVVVDIDKKLHRKFSQAVKDVGTKKKFAIAKMIEDFVLNAEANPSYFNLLSRDRRHS